MRRSVIMASRINKVVPVYLNGGTGDVLVSEKAVERAAIALRKGKLIGIPTDTIYGLACSAQSNEGLSAIYSTKQRQHSKPVAICVADVPDLFKWAKVTVSDLVLRDLLPGPVTVVFERLPSLNCALNPDVKLIGVRIPDSEFIRAVARTCDFPLALTSANKSSLKSSLCVEEFEDLWPALEVVFDGGNLGEIDPERLGSTVVDLSNPGSFRIIRRGCASSFVINVLAQKYKLTLTDTVERER